MTTDDRVLVIGGDGAGPSTPPTPPPSNRRIWMVGVVGLVLIAVGYAVSSPDETLEPETQLIQAPVEPPTSRSLTFDGGSGLSLVDGWSVSEPFGTGDYIASLDRGSGGWLAVSHSIGIEALTSRDGETWRVQSLPLGAMWAMAPTASVGQRLVVAGTDWMGTAWSASSEDNGSTWDLAIIDEMAKVSGVYEVNRAVYAVGARVPSLIDLWGLNGQAAGWWLNGSEWVPLDFSADSGGRSGLVGMFDVDGATMAVGYDSGGVVAWRLTGPRLEWVEVTGGEGLFIRSLVRTTRGRFVAVAETTADASLLVVSDDLRHWERIEGTVGYEAVFAAGNDVLGRRGESTFVITDPTNPRLVQEEIGIVTGAAAGRDGTVVVASVADLGPQTVLARHDATAPVIESDTTNDWVRVAGMTMQPDLDGLWRTGSGVRWQNSVAYLTGRTVTVVDLEAPWNVRPSDGRADQLLGTVDDGLWVIVDDEIRVLSDVSDPTVSEPVGTPVEFFGATVSDTVGGPVVVGYTPVGFAAWTVSEGSDVQVVEVPIQSVAAVPGGFIGDAWESGQGLMFSPNGVDWEPIDLVPSGARLAPALVDAVPFTMVERDADRSVVALFDLWPDIGILEIPDPFPFLIRRTSDGLMVQTPQAVLVLGPDDVWQRIPADAEVSIGSFAALQPFDRPVLARSEAGGSIEFFEPAAP